EFKTDMDLERLPSGKFDSNDLVLNLGALTYNILKHIGLCGLLDEDAPVRHSAKRRRIKTVIQELMYVAARLIKRSRQLWLRFGKNCSAFSAFNKVYKRLVYE
ncbi:transposase, partial [Candidatus Venteria ishoeyi]